jgi:hypothetical protein
MGLYEAASAVEIVSTRARPSHCHQAELASALAGFRSIAVRLACGGS